MGGEPVEQLAKNLADNLRYLRERRGLTQARLSELSEVPRSTLANLETGSGNPTLGVLARLTSALQISVEELLGAPRRMGRVIPAAEREVQRRGRGCEVYKLLPDPLPGMEIDRLVLPPGGWFKGIPHRPGTREYLCCERGALVLETGGERFDLDRGDVAAFHGDHPHTYRNPGDEPAVAFRVVTLAPTAP